MFALPKADLFLTAIILQPVTVSVSFCQLMLFFAHPRMGHDRARKWKYARPTLQHKYYDQEFGS